MIQGRNRKASARMARKRIVSLARRHFESFCFFFRWKQQTEKSRNKALRCAQVTRLIRREACGSSERPRTSKEGPERLGHDFGRNCARSRETPKDEARVFGPER